MAHDIRSPYGFNGPSDTATIATRARRHASIGFVMDDTQQRILQLLETLSVEGLNTGRKRRSIGTR
jgi:hypothetical protein